MTEQPDFSPIELTNFAFDLANIESIKDTALGRVLSEIANPLEDAVLGQEFSSHTSFSSHSSFSSFSSHSSSW